MSNTELKLNGVTVLSENNGNITLDVNQLTGATFGELNFNSTNHQFTLKGVDAPIVGANFSTSDDANSGQLAIYNGATKLWGITESGYVVNPNVPSFKVGLNDDTTFAATNPIIFNSTNVSSAYHFNSGNHYSNTTGYFTAPVDGKYFFTTLIIWRAVATTTSMADAFYIMVNGNLATYSFRRGVYVDNYTGTGNYYTDFANVIVPMYAGDYAWIRNTGNSTTVHGNTTYTWFAGYLIG